jgi:amino acid transporter
MFSRLRRTLIGPPIPTRRMSQESLGKFRALAAFSPDALSSIAYANQEIYLGLIVAGSGALNLAWPIGLAITALLVMTALSYYQTVFAYPSGGGSYAVARDNLGTVPGLCAAAALLVDYVLTAAVSLTAGVAAIASAFPGLWPFRVPIALGLLLLITIANLRGLRETGSLMAVPVYFFLFTYLPMLAYGAFGMFTGNIPVPPAPSIPATSAVTPLLLLHTFAAGCTALTGIEAISNGVPSFKSPEAKNAGQTLVIMALLMGTLFLGSIGLTQFLSVTAGPDETILSALARRILGNGPLYYVVQVGTMLILAVAANTSFAGFPRLAAILAKDGFLPRPLGNLGDRLVYNNGIVLLALAATLLIVVFGGDTHLLIPLFAVGVFLAFTLSQAGMVLHWRRVRGPRWLLKSMVNGAGAVATGVTLVVVAIGKFIEGAWIILVLLPLLVIAFLQIQRHFNAVGRELSLQGIPPSLKPTAPQRLVIPVSGLHRGIVEAVDIARGISENVTALYIELQPGAGDKLRQDWEQWFPDVPLVIRPSPYRTIVGTLLDYLEETDREHNDGQLAAVILPEFIPAKPWQSFLHNQTGVLIRTALLYNRRRLRSGRVIIDVPYYLKR